jgi:hypothetical protein
VLFDWATPAIVFVNEFSLSRVLGGGWGRAVRRHVHRFPPQRSTTPKINGNKNENEIND